ncbi:RBBP9/YdeN family alpha/beta hydrolase [Actinoplanes sp. GCM10030250]|uniref:RBBP9/YdeN family alpha/beta hydrolase n=1 Tax=Actinoplanes sp. GCM10030250 TaxID=3273376 RepID=UPI003619C68D
MVEASAVTRVLLVPGRGKAFDGHWSWQWFRQSQRDPRGPRYAWAPEPPGPPYVPEERVAALDEALRASDEPAVLVAHSAGCLTVAFWAEKHGHEPHAALVRAALQVTPPDVSGRLETPWAPLPFRTVVVGSRNDPHSTFEAAEANARDWGAEIVDAGPVGHLDSKTGFGPWPQGERLVAALVAGVPLHPYGS